jgi:cyanophycin synthetase
VTTDGGGSGNNGAATLNGTRTDPAAAERAEHGRHRDGEEDPAARPTRVRERSVYRGPNPYGYRPAVRYSIDLGCWEHHPTDTLGCFTDRLLEVMPTLHTHGCSYGEPGGFVRRMREGTWLAHVAEHVAIELQCLAGTPVTYGKTRSVPGEPSGVYNVVYSFQEERVGLLAGRLALRLIDQLLPPELKGIGGLDLLLPADMTPPEDTDPFDYQAELEALIRVAQRQALGPTTQSLVDEAKRRGIPFIRLDEHSLVQLGYGKYQQRVRASVTSADNHIAVETASNKELTRRLLADAGIPVPRGEAVVTPDEAVRAAKRLRSPVVVKPLDANHGRGVSLDLTDEDDVRQAFDLAREHGRTRQVIVEQFFKGHDYRVLVIGGKLAAAAHRVPAHVVGDGQHTIAELVEIVNRDPRRGIGHEKVMTRITLDGRAERLLAQCGRTPETVPAEGETVYLAETANLSTGGTAVDVTAEIHPENRDLLERAAKVIGLGVAGLDVISPDLSRPLLKTGGGIIEVNAGPGFRMHLAPSEGRRRNVARPVIDLLFPDGVPCRIPVIAITGTNGKTTTSRMVAHILKTHGQIVALTTSTGIYIDGHTLMEGDTTGPKSARMALRDPTIDAAVLETARGGIVREGMGFDTCDVGCVTNIAADHLGLKGVDTVEDLARIKSVVVEVVAPSGHSVLNADDPLVSRMRRRAGGRIVFFSYSGHSGDDCPRFLRHHIEDGGTAVVRQPGIGGDLIVIYDGGEYVPLMWTHQIPVTLSGKARHNVENALAAVAIAHSLQIPLDTIRQALGSFMPTFEDNPGRLNVYDKLPFKVIMDYAHNPAGWEAMADLVRGMRPRKGEGRVLVCFTGTGDRRDEDIRELGRVAASMADEVVIKETPLLRGRKPGEVPGLVKEGVLAAGISEERIGYTETEEEGVDEVLRRARPGDLVVISCDKSTACWERIKAYRPTPEQMGEAEPSRRGEAADAIALDREEEGLIEAPREEVSR